jgi:CspA family cold shock protein
MILLGRAGGVAFHEETIMARGTIVRMIRDRGFGFVQAEDGKEIFFHHSTLPSGVFDSLADGQTLEFDIENDQRGRGERATNVQVVE